MPYSDAYIELLTAGAFAGQIDPWAEAGKYFHQIHARMIGYLIDVLNPQLRQMGYRAGRETSLQIMDNRQPDIFIHRRDNTPSQKIDFQYGLAAAEMLADAGEIMIYPDIDLDAVYIRARETGNLVTIIELISPANKHCSEDIQQYQIRRAELVYEKGVNVVEPDLTRSIKRLCPDIRVQDFPYHISIYLPDEADRFIGVEQHNSLPRLAIPLRYEVAILAMQDAYDTAYRANNIADSLLDETGYEMTHLPFSSLLADNNRDSALNAINVWRNQLHDLQETNQ